MSDTTFYVAGRKIRINGAVKAVLVYVAIDIVLSGIQSLGQFLHGLKREDWEALWGPQRWGLVLMQLSSILGSAILTFKVALSKSTKTNDTTISTSTNT